jgi:hypothetical protein
VALILVAAREAGVPAEAVGAAPMVVEEVEAAGRVRAEAAEPLLVAESVLEVAFQVRAARVLRLRAAALPAEPPTRGAGWAAQTPIQRASHLVALAPGGASQPLSAQRWRWREAG